MKDKINIECYKDDVSIPLWQLALLCLNVDYKIKDECLDAVEELSVDLQKKFNFCTHEYRMEISDTLKGSI